MRNIFSSFLRGLVIGMWIAGVIGVAMGVTLILSMLWRQYVE